MPFAMRVREDMGWICGC